MKGALIAKYDSRKSFYGKAVVFEKNGNTYLESYFTNVLGIDNDGNVHRYWGGYSATTLRHIWEFVRQYDDEYGTKIADSIRKVGNGAKWFRSLPVEEVNI